MEEQLVDPLLADAESPLLLLQVLCGRLPLCRSLLDQVINICGVEAVHDLPEEVALGQPLLALARWVRQVVRDVLELERLRVDVLDRQLRPVGHGLGRDLRLEQRLLGAVEDGLDVREAGLLQGRHQVAH